MIRKKVENFIFNQLTSKQVRYVHPILTRHAEGKVADIYKQIRRDFQLVPPLTMFSPAPNLLAVVWGVLRECQIATGNVPRRLTEAVATAVSHLNACPYCVDAHSGMLHALSDHEVPTSIFRDNPGGIEDLVTQKVIRWALATRSPKDPIISFPPFSREEASEIIGTAVVYHFLNRMVTVFLKDSPFPGPLAWTSIRKYTARVLGAAVGSSIIKRKPLPGESLKFLPKADLPHPAWADSNSNISKAFSGFYSVLDEIGQQTLSTEVREIFQKQLSIWNGEDSELNCHWVEEVIIGLEEKEKSSARLVFLTAFSTHQVDEKIIQNFKKINPSDAQLIGAAAWASYMVSKRISSWLRLPTSEEKGKVPWTGDGGNRFP